VAKFSFQESVKGDTSLLTLSGYLDEHAVLPEPPKTKDVRIFMNAISGLNSVGTRIWCQWVKKVNTPSKVYIECAPVIFVRAFSSVKGALGANMEILSFYVPFYSVQLGERKDVLFELGRQFFEDGRIVEPTVKDSKGGVMEMDVLSSYFEFIKNKI
jgi:hypothetical protein